MRFWSITFLLLALCGCDEPLLMELDNECTVTYTDGSTEKIICRYAELDKPAFRTVSDGQIEITFHDISKRYIPMKNVKHWSFKWGDKDHYGRYEKLQNRDWVKKGRAGVDAE